MSFICISNHAHDLWCCTEKCETKSKQLFSKCWKLMFYLLCLPWWLVNSFPHLSLIFLLRLICSTCKLTVLDSVYVAFWLILATMRAYNGLFWNEDICLSARGLEERCKKHFTSKGSEWGVKRSTIWKNKAGLYYQKYRKTTEKITKESWCNPWS